LKQRLNFAPNPFLHRHPLAMAIWTLNLLALLAIGWLGLRWYQLRAKNAEAHTSMGQLQQERQSLVDRHRDILAQLDAVNFSDYRRQMTLFQGIQTSFSTQWGPLLDTLGTLLPEDVRLLELKPGTRPGGENTQTVLLQLRGEARTKDAELRFMEALDNQPEFSNVVFESETYDQPGVAVAFEIQFAYEPRGLR